MTVSDLPGLATLNILDAGDTASGDADIEPTTVTGLDFGSGGSVSYAGGVVGGIIDLNVYGGTNGGSGVTYNVSGTSAVTTLYGGPNDNIGERARNGCRCPPQHLWRGRTGCRLHRRRRQPPWDPGRCFRRQHTLTPGFTDLTVDASADAVSHDFTLSSSGPDSTLIGPGAGDDHLHTADLSSLTINTSDFGNQVMNIDMSGGNPIPVVDTPGLIFNAGADSAPAVSTATP